MPTPTITSRLPSVGTTIFSTMSALAAQHGAVNLGQGFPDFDCDAALVDAVAAAMRSGLNQYAPMTGLPALRQAVADKIAAQHGQRYDADAQITITAGATQAILSAVLAVVQPGDEVIVLDPCYDSYAPAVQMAGGTLVRVPLQPLTFRPDLQAIERAITPRTRLLIVNTPHNPTASVWTRDEMLRLQDILASTRVLLLADEVYEHMVFDGQSHHSAAAFEGLAQRAFIVSSFGKTFHVTGWKIGTVAAPADLMREFRKIHQFNVFSVNTPMQAGIAQYLKIPAHYQNLSAFYQQKRDLFAAALKEKTRFELLPCAGTYFQCVKIDKISRGMNENEFCQWLTTEIGVAAIPISAFYGDGFDQQIIRFCFAKKDETLQNAIERLAKV